MSQYVCSIVPPHLLQVLSQSDRQDEEVRRSAEETLAITRAFHHSRRGHLHDLATHPHHHHPQGGSQPQSIVPDVLLEHLSQADNVDDSVKKSAAESLAISRQVREGRKVADTPTAVSDTQVQFHRGVYDMKNAGKGPDPQSLSLLPGTPARLESQPAVSDKAVNQAYDSTFLVLDFYRKLFNYISVDGRNMPIISSVHFAKAFANAMWSPGKQQMVYGDGNQILYNFTGCLDVIAHEITHGVTEKNSGLEYEGESGALNEHISDVFGIMVKQMAENTTAEQSDWLIGEGCLYPDIQGVALRNMKEPGTAYDDPKLGGRDPQPARYSDIRTFTDENQEWVDNDNGGVHLFSGIPNCAFATIAIAFGGYSWEKAGKIWWETVSTRQIPTTCTFLTFADKTVEITLKRYGADDAKVVRDAWNQVGVVREI